jgi:putative FmdB family regulatory protein
MPTYVYRRSDGSTFEIEQRISEPALEVCPETSLPVKRVISGAGLIFKGQGFYLTDYSRKSNGESSSEKSDSGSGASETKTAA